MVNERYKHFSTKLIKKLGTDGLHKLILKRGNMSDFQAHCCRVIKVLDLISAGELYGNQINFFYASIFLERSGLTPREALDLHEDNKKVK